MQVRMGLVVSAMEGYFPNLQNWSLITSCSFLSRPDRIVSIYVHITKSPIYISSSCRAISTDIPDPLSPPLPIVHRFRQVLRAAVCRCELVALLCSAMWRGPQEHITYEHLPTSQAVSCMPGSSHFDSFRDRW